MNNKSIVAISKVKDDIYFSMSEAMEKCSWKKYIKKGEDIALKINLGWDIFIPGSITSPLITESVIKSIYDYVKNIYIVDSNQVFENIEKAFYRSNTHRICKKYAKVNWLNLSNLKKTKIEKKDNYIVKTMEIPQRFLDMDFISVAVMKTHDKTTITGALKNQWGCLPESRHEYHLEINEAIADINSVVTPVFSIIDGTVGLEANGPKNGKPKEMNLIIAGRDPVAVDTVMAELMGFDSSKILHFINCNLRGLGENRIDKIKVVGEKIENHRQLFIPAKHNLISKLELFFRKSFLKKVLFNTFIFSIALVFGKSYYRIWMRFKGRKIWKKFLSHSVYAKQWHNSFTDKFK